MFLFRSCNCCQKPLRPQNVEWNSATKKHEKIENLDIFEILESKMNKNNQYEIISINRFDISENIRKI